MASEKTDAIVLRIVEFSETSLVVTLFTRLFGKTAAIAKGARRPKSSCEGALDLLTVCRVLLHLKSNENLDLLTEAKLERRFRSGERDLGRLYAGYYVAELLRELTDHHDPHPEVFDLTLATLVALDGNTDVRGCLLRYEIQILRLLGHAPLVDRCADCGVVLPREPWQTADESTPCVPFVIQSGGVVCNSCRTSSRGIILLRGESWRWLKSQLTGSAASSATSKEADETADVVQLSLSSHGELRGLMSRYIASITGGSLRMTPYLTQRH
jgi:DNA repair protein RecO (recombination protein O)